MQKQMNSADGKNSVTMNKEVHRRGIRKIQQIKRKIVYG
jgi:hypothetical protein